MRIRKQHLRENIRGDSSSPNPGPGGQEQELVHNFGRVKEKPGNEGQMVENGQGSIGEGSNERSGTVQVGGGICRVDSASRSQFTWLDKLRHSKGFTELEPYSNLEDYVKKLSKRDVLIPVKGLARIPEEVTRGIDLHRLVGGTSLDALHLAKCGPASSEVKFKQAPVVELERTSSLALLSCDNSSNSFADVQGDAGLPTSFCNEWNATDQAKGFGDLSPNKSSVASDLRSYDACKEAEDLELSLGRRDICKEGRRSPPKRMRDSFEWLVESSGKRDRAGRNSLETLVGNVKSRTMEDPCADIALRPAVFEAGLFAQGHVDSIGEPAEMISGVLQNDQTEAAAGSPQRRKWSIPAFTDVNTGQVRHASTIAENSLPLPPDHPAQQPKESLAFSLYTVCKRTGKEGLTAKEIMSVIMEQGLAGLEQGAVQSSRRIAKLLRSSPYYMEIGGGKFALCSAVIDLQQNLVCEGPSPNWQCKDSSQYAKRTESSTVNDFKTSGDSEGNLSIIGQRWKRNCGAQEREISSPEIEIQVKSKPVRSGRPKKLKYLKQENAEDLGNQCNRTDGKGWICPLLAKPGYQLCDYHLNKLRCKPGSRSKKKKKKKLAATPADEAQVSHAPEDPHVVDTAGHEFSTPGNRVANPVGDFDDYRD